MGMRPNNRHEPVPFWLVWADDGQMARFLHGSASAAEAEAKRLAAENPGQTFYVLEPISASVKRDVETTVFERPAEIPF